MMNLDEPEQIKERIKYNINEIKTSVKKKRKHAINIALCLVAGVGLILSGWPITIYLIAKYLIIPLTLISVFLCSIWMGYEKDVRDENIYLHQILEVEEENPREEE